jgi:signal transduction histidine kinase
MPLGPWSHARLFDAEGRLFAAASPEGASAETVELPLPDGGRLELEARSRAPMWRTFTHALVHEFRSPLNALAIYADLLSTASGDAPGAENRQRLANRAHEQVMRLEALLVLFERLWAAPSRGPANLSVLVQDVVVLAGLLGRSRGLTFRAAPAPELWAREAPSRVVERLLSICDLLAGMASDGAVLMSLERHGEENVLALRLSGEGAEAACRRCVDVGLADSPAAAQLLVRFHAAPAPLEEGGAT